MRPVSPLQLDDVTGIAVVKATRRRMMSAESVPVLGNMNHHFAFGGGWHGAFQYLVVEDTTPGHVRKPARL
jgi:hypothetical protein